LKHYIQRIIQIIIIFSLLTACTQNENVPVVAKSKKVNVQINITEDVNLLKPNKTVLPDQPSISVYKLLGSTDNGSNYNQITSFTGSTGTTVALSPGEWRFLLEAYDGSNKNVLSDQTTYTSANVTISETANNSPLNFTLKTLTTGTGGLSIKLTLPVGHSVASVETKIDGTSITPTLTVVNNTITYSSSTIAPGDHFVNFRHLDGTGNLLISVTELIAVYPNIETMWEETILETDMNAPPEAPSGLTAVIEPTNATQSKVKLTWTDESNNETGFIIVANSADLTTDINAGFTTFTINVDRAKNFVFNIKAINDFGESYSDPTPSITTPQLWTIDYTSGGATGTISPTKHEDDTTTDLPSQGSLDKRQDGIIMRFNGWHDGVAIKQPGDIVTVTSDLTFTAQWSVIGGVGPAGGYVFYDKTAVTDGWRYLEVAPPTAVATTHQWGKSGTDIPPEGFIDLITGGKSNTILINAFMNQPPAFVDSAAQICETLPYSTKADWFLPTYLQAKEIYTNLHLKGIGGYENINYWTTNEIDSFKSQQISFTDGLSTSTSKTNLLRILPVRAFRSTNATYIVMYHGNNNSTGLPPTDFMHYEQTDDVIIKSHGLLEKAGYTFNGWNTKADGTGTPYTEGLPSVNLADNLLLYAQWSGNPYTVIFDGDGATTEATPNTAVAIFPTYTVVLPTPPLKTGCIFDGWFTGTNGGLPQFFETTFVNADITVFAKWTPANFTITYNPGTGSGGVPPQQTTAYLSPVTISNNDGPLTTIETQDGMTKVFYCWNTQSDGLGDDYTPGQTFPMGSANLILYPKFSVIGATGPAGGLVFYDKGDNADGWRYLEADPNSTTVTKTWGKNTELVGNTLQTIGAGKKNSAYINSFMNNPAVTNTAAQYCENLTSGGKSDWFFPSKSEMIEMNTQLHKRGLGNFLGTTYWTSSELSATYPFYITWSTGVAWSNNNKLPTLTVRPARAFRSANQTFVVVYHANESTSGTVPVDNYHYESSDPVTIANNTGILAKTGLTFNGWNTKPYGSGTHYDEGQAVPNLTDNLVLYAEWKPTFSGGDGNLATPYQITNADQLHNVRYAANQSYIVNNPIDLNVAPYNTLKGWKPIGDSSTPFTGNFDGNGQPITGLYINNANEQNGLFGKTANPALLENVVLVNVNISGNVSNQGALAGFADSSMVKNSFVLGGTITTNYNMVGGLIGVANNSTISQSYTQNMNLNVGTGNVVGGLIGYALGVTSYITDCYSTSSVISTISDSPAGGLIGSINNGAVVSNCYATGSVTGLGANIGGVIGNNISSTGIISNSYYDKNTTGMIDTGKGDGKTTAEMTNQVTFSGWDFVTTPIWKIDPGSYPYLQWQGILNIPTP